MQALQALQLKQPPTAKTQDDTQIDIDKVIHNLRVQAGTEQHQQQLKDHNVRRRQEIQQVQQELRRATQNKTAKKSNAKKSLDRCAPPFTAASCKKSSLSVSTTSSALLCHFTRQQLAVLRTAYNAVEPPITIHSFEAAIASVGGGLVKGVTIKISGLDFHNFLKVALHIIRLDRSGRHAALDDRPTFLSNNYSRQQKAAEYRRKREQEQKLEQYQLKLKVEQKAKNAQARLQRVKALANKTASSRSSSHQAMDSIAHKLPLHERPSPPRGSPPVKPFARGGTAKNTCGTVLYGKDGKDGNDEDIRGGNAVQGNQSFINDIQKRIRLKQQQRQHDKQQHMQQKKQRQILQRVQREAQKKEYQREEQEQQEEEQEEPLLVTEDDQSLIKQVQQQQQQQRRQQQQRQQEYASATGVKQPNLTGLHSLLSHVSFSVPTRPQTREQSTFFTAAPSQSPRRPQSRSGPKQRGQQRGQQHRHHRHLQPQRRTGDADKGRRSASRSASRSSNRGTKTELVELLSLIDATNSVFVQPKRLTARRR